jgi:trehalose synthase
MSSPDDLELLTVPAAATRPATAHKEPEARPEPQPETQPDTADYVQWLASNAMLERASKLAQSVTKTRGTQRAFAEPQPRLASAAAPAWLTVYPASHLGRAGESVLAALGDEQLWSTLIALGIRGMHTGPMKSSGGVSGRMITPTIDGYFDRIGMEIDASFGNEAEYKKLTATARRHGAIVIGDIIPGHTGKGYDFRLAERAYRDYPGLYQMVEIDRADWGLLPDVPAGKDSVNLLPEVVDQLVGHGYVPGRLQRTIFYTKGVKETDFSATDIVVGVDGVERRWVYLHYFKEGQPTLDWLDPSFGAQRLVLGDAVHSLRTLGDSMLRLDANGFLGIEPRPNAPAWSEGHPLSLTSNQLIAGLVRRLGGFTFQELNLTFGDLRDMTQGGADLSYDFVTRPAYHHALVTGDTSFLRLVLDLQSEYKIDPASLVHALQNHDELTLELVHFFEVHAGARFHFRGGEVLGRELRDTVIAEMHEALLAPRAPYNLMATNGVSCTTASLVAAALGIHDLAAIGDAERAQIQQGHLLLAMYNALQPGVFAVSGWDLVGAVPLAPSAVAELVAEGDTRWIQRGAYDLLGASSAPTSAAGLPRSPALYGPLPAQLADPRSFASQLRHILVVRAQHRIHESRRLATPATAAPGLLVLVHELPGAGGIEITALNFGRTAVDELIDVPAAAGRVVHDLLADAGAGAVTPDGKLRVQLAPLEGQALLAR